MKSIVKEVLFGGRGAATVWGDVGLAIARLSFGLFMAIGHGMGKVYSEGRFGPPEQLVEGTGALGFPAPLFFAWCAALTEFLGGLLVAAGLFTRPAAAFLVFNMGVAAFVAHAADPLFTAGGAAKEPALLYLVPFLMFVFTGAGRFSLDALIRRK